MSSITITVLNALTLSHFGTVVSYFKVSFVSNGLLNCGEIAKYSRSFLYRPLHDTDSSFGPGVTRIHISF